MENYEEYFKWRVNKQVAKLNKEFFSGTCRNEAIKMGNDKLDEGLIYSGVSSEWQDAGNYTITIDTNSPGATVGGVVMIILLQLKTNRGSY